MSIGDRRTNSAISWEVKLLGKPSADLPLPPPNKGGKNYRKFYEDSRISTRDKTGRTKTGLYAIFIPADYSTMGFFDQWGYPVYDNPNTPVKNELGELINIGIKQYLDHQEAACGDNIRKFNEQKRNNPRVDTDAFLDEDASNMYATTGMTNLNNLLKNYQTTPKYKQQVFLFDLIWKNGITDGEVEMVRNSKGRFMAYAPNGFLPIHAEFRNQHNRINAKKNSAQRTHRSNRN